MLDVLYEDKDVLVVVKPAGIESQTSRRLEPDMVSEIKNYLHRKAQEAKKLSTGLSPKASTVTVEPYVGVIHRLDKPVRGVMVYAKNQKAAAHLSRQVQDGKLEKIYQAVVCGKPVDNVGKYVDYLLKDGKTNTSRIVDKSAAGAKRAELEYQILEEKNREMEQCALWWKSISTPGVIIRSACSLLRMERRWWEIPSMVHQRLPPWDVPAASRWRCVRFACRSFTR